MRRSLAGGAGRIHGWVNPTRSPGIRTVSVPTNQLDYSFSSGRFKGYQKDSLLILSFTVLLLQAFEEQCGILLSRFRCKPT